MDRFATLKIEFEVGDHDDEPSEVPETDDGGNSLNDEQGRDFVDDQVSGNESM